MFYGGPVERSVMAELGSLIGYFLGGLVIVGILTRLINWILAKYNIPDKTIPLISASSVAIFSILVKSLISDFNTEDVGIAVAIYTISAILWLVYDLRKIKHNNQ